MKRTPVLVTAIAAVALTLTGGTLTAHAAPADDAAKIAALFPGATRAQVEASLDQTAAVTGTSRNAVAKRILREADAAAVPGARLSGKAATDAITPMAAATVPLIAPRQAGDIFVLTNGAFGFGHTGIYVNSSQIVHAPGLGVNSLADSYINVGAASGSVGQEITTVSARAGAASYALTKLVGKPYNINFWNNKYVVAKSYNCSQLVWASYKGAASLDLDGNGGLGVYPWDLEKSKLTTTYYTY